MANRRERPKPKRGERWDGATYLQLASSSRAANLQPEARPFNEMVAQGQLHPPPGLGVENTPSYVAIRRPLSPTEEGAVRSFRDACVWALKDGRGHEEALDQILQWGAWLLLRFNEWSEAETRRKAGPAPL